ncbi:MAG: hypothetical protein J6I69_02200 [Bacilli bacterium]|nr:hypothetical protein [Bacilli bacterium]
MSLRKLASQVGIPSSTVISLALGRRTILPKYNKVLNYYFGCTGDYLTKASDMGVYVEYSGGTILLNDEQYSNYLSQNQLIIHYIELYPPVRIGDYTITHKMVRRAKELANADIIKRTNERIRYGALNSIDSFLEDDINRELIAISKDLKDYQTLLADNGRARLQILEFAKKEYSAITGNEFSKENSDNYINIDNNYIPRKYSAFNSK